MIQDSGDRREFNTGAVRDMAEGKGRCDLLPACAVLRLAKHFESGAKNTTIGIGKRAYLYIRSLTGLTYEQAFLSQED